MNLAKNLMTSQYLLNILSPKLELQIHQKLEFKTSTISVFFSFFCWPHCISLFDEILFSTTFSKTFSTIVENVKTQCISTFLNTRHLFLHKRPYTPPSFLKRNVFSIAEDFRNIYILLPFLQFFTVDEVCNILYKYWYPNKLAKH